MLTVLSPSKSLNYITSAQTDKYSFPKFIKDATELISYLRLLNPKQIASLMNISEHVATLSFTQYQHWSAEFSIKNTKQALLAFSDDIYESLDAHSLSQQALEFAQQSMRILSGLYGLLRPLDWIQPYRLEMSTRLVTARGKNIYAFWGERITLAINTILADQNSSILVNLASHEYIKAIKFCHLKAKVITPVFEDWNSNANHYRIVPFFSKRARGLMARYIIDNRITDVQKLKSFNLEGYTFADAGSSTDTWVFHRKSPCPTE